MAFSKARRLGDLITANAEQFITSAHITDTAITGSDIHSTFNLTGKTVTVATASAGDNDTSVASTAFVQQEIASLVDSAPGTLNTLNELAAALGDDASFSTTVTNSIATKLPLAGGALTGNLSTNSRIAIGQSTFTGGNTLVDIHGSGSGVGANIAFANDHNTDKFYVGVAGDTTGDVLVYNAEDSDMIFATNNSERMRIMNNGSVGIGTSSPFAGLQVADNEVFIHGGSTTTGPGIFLGDNNFNNSNYYNSAPGIGAVGPYGGVTGGLGFYYYAGAQNSRNEAMRINSSGQVGIGTTSPDSGQILDVRGNVRIGDGSAVEQDIHFESANGSWQVGSNDSGNGTSNNQFYIYDGNSSAYPLTVQRGGNVGIGTNSPSRPLEVTGSATDFSGEIKVNNSSSASGAHGSIQFVTEGESSGLIIGKHSSGFSEPDLAFVFNELNTAMIFGTNNTERMRIQSGGRLLLNKTDSQSTPARFDVTRNSGEHAINTFVNTTGNSSILAFWNTNGIVGTINTSGSATSYNTSSDARLKNVLGEAKGLEIINALNPVNFEWKSDGKTQDGLIAQEVEEVFPQAVSEPELEGEWYSVDYSKFATPLIKAIQEQQAIIEDLKSRIETLEG